MIKIYIASIDPKIIMYFPPRDHVPAARECLVDFLSVSALCLPEEDRPGLNVTLAMVDSAIEFPCHNDGDRIACEYNIRITDPRGY